jgi:GT2 family glycosyltransferase
MRRDILIGPMRILLAEIADAPRHVGSLLQVAARALDAIGHEPVSLPIPALGLPAGEADTATPDRFVLTPGALIESWRVARHLTALTSPGDVVLISDYGGRGGLFAVEQAMIDPRDRRHVWTLVGSGLAIEALHTFGVAAAPDPEGESSIDWELAQYRFSEVRLTLAQRAADLLAKVAPEVDLLHARGTMPVNQPSVGVDGGLVVIPEVPSRGAGTAAVMRGVTQAMSLNDRVHVAVESGSTEDVVWSGSTWETVAGLEIMGDRIDRTSTGGLAPAMVVMGNPFALPPESVKRWYDAGVRVLVPRGSVAGNLMPSASTWSDESDIARFISGEAQPPSTIIASTFESLVPPEPLFNGGRARRVSVGIPIHRDVRFLEECVASVLSQTQRPHELVLYDDGSQDPTVTAKLDDLATRHSTSILVRSGPNRGVCVARNAMISSMTGDAFALVDSDDILHPEFIEACAEGLRANPGLDAVATWTDFFGGYEGIEAKPPFSVRTGMRENTIVSTAAVVDMSVRERGIAFAPDLAFLYCEDWHYWSQIIGAGGRLGLVPRALVRHRVHATSGATRRTDFAHTIGRLRATEPLWGRSDE